MFLSRRSILGTFLLSFPSVATGYCYEVGPVGTVCPDMGSPKVAVCTATGEVNRTYAACCSNSEPDPPTSYDSASTCAFDDALADTETPVYPCYQIGPVGKRCWDPTHRKQAICNVTYFNTHTETFQACCTSDTTVPSSAEPGSVCVLSSAPSSGAWTVTVLAAVATTVAAALTGF